MIILSLRVSLHSEAVIFSPGSAVAPNRCPAAHPSLFACLTNLFITLINNLSALGHPSHDAPLLPLSCVHYEGTAQCTEEEAAVCSPACVFFSSSGVAGVLRSPVKGCKFRTGKSGGSGDGVHGGGGAHAAAPPVPTPPRTAAHWEGPLPAPSPPFVSEPQSSKPCRFPWSAACVCGTVLRIGGGGFGWGGPWEGGRLGFSSPCC